MKRVIKLLCLTFVFAFVVGVVGFFNTLQAVRAEEAGETATEETVTEADYAKVWVNDLGGFDGDGATRDAKTNGVSSIAKAGRVGYDTYFENVEVKSTVRFTARDAGDHVTFHLRLQDDVEKRGYQFRWYGNGRYQILKNNVPIYGETPKWNFVATNTTADFEVVFSTINLSDGSVKITFSVGTKTVSITDTVGIDYEETESNKAPVFGAGKYMVAFGTKTSGSIQGDADFTTNAISLYDIASPQTNKNFSGVKVNDDGSVNISGTNAIGASGVGFGFQQTDFAFYKFKYTPSSSSSGKLKITLGASELNRIANLSGASKGYAKTLPALEAGTTYEIVHGVDVLTDGVNTVNRIITKVGDNVYVEVDANNTISFNKSGTPGALYKWFIIQNEEWSFHSGTISPSDSTVKYDQKTLLTDDLGTPATHSGATFDRNGGIFALSSGRNAGYNGNFKNTLIKFDANLTATGSMILQLRAEGKVYDTPWNSWTNSGYAVYLYTNGQTTLTKNGATLCEGWSLSSTTLAVNTKHTIEFGTVNLTEDAVRVFCNIDNSPVINYVDVTNPLNNAGWFTIYNNDGLKGSLMPYGVEYPQVTADVASGDKAFTNIPVTLGYTLTNADSSDEVSYYIDTAKSTAEAEITGSELVATTAGNVVVYACVNGIYSNDLIIEVVEPAKPELVNVPKTMVYGQNVTIDAKFSDDTEITTKEFVVEKVSGEATIDSDGKITPVKVGTIKVYAIVNGFETKKHIITIVPEITIEQASIIKGKGTTLEYTANCDLPTDISLKWEIVSGEDVATINSSTGEVTTLKTGEFTVKLTLTSSAFGEVEVGATEEFTVIAPVIINLPEAPLVVGGETWTVGAEMSGGSTVSSLFYVTDDSKEFATIDEATGEITPVKAGTIKVYAIVNGEKTQEHPIRIVPVISITPPTTIVKDRGVKLEYTANCELPTEGIKLKWEIVSGNNIAFNDETEEFTVQDVGEFTVKLTLTSNAFGEVSATLSLNVAPVLILPNTSLIAGGEKWIVSAEMSDGIAVETIVFGITNISGWATINADGEVTPVKAGTVKVYATVNGFKTEEKIVNITPKVFINKEGSFAFGGVYNLNDYYKANCQLPDEQITVSFEIVGGGEYATLDSATGILTVGSTPGKVGLRVYVTGETFYANSAVTTISVEKPIVIVQNSFLGDLYVGQSVTLAPSISQGGIEVESARIDVVSGGDCVQINGLTITAIKPGTFKYKIVVNNTLVNDDEGLEIAIEKLVATIIANNEMTVNKTQQAQLMFNTNDGYGYTSAVWSVISGQDKITVSETGLITSIKEGKATVKVVIDGIFEATLEITVHGNVVLHGVSQGSKVLVGGAIQLSFKIEESVVGEVQTVEYVVVSGKDCVSLTADGKLEAIKSGTVKIKVVVNGIESQTISFDVFKNKSGENNNKFLWIIMGSCVGGALVIAGIVLGVVLSTKKSRLKKVEVVANEVDNSVTEDDKE